MEVNKILIPRRFESIDMRHLKDYLFTKLIKKAQRDKRETSFLYVASHKQETRKAHV